MGKIEKSSIAIRTFIGLFMMYGKRRKKAVQAFAGRPSFRAVIGCHSIFAS